MTKLVKNELKKYRKKNYDRWAKKVQDFNEKLMNNTIAKKEEEQERRLLTWTKPTRVDDKIEYIDLDKNHREVTRKPASAKFIRCAIPARLFVKPAQVTIASLENRTHLAKGGWSAVERNARVQMMNDMHSHAHCTDNAEQTFESPRVSVAAGFIAWMMRCPCQKKTNVNQR